MLQETKNPWYRERWPWILMLGPAVVVVAGITTAWLAVSSSDGLVSDDYYKEGLAVNQSLHRDNEAARLGLQATLMRSETQLRVMMLAPGIAMPKTLEVKLVHPTVPGQDQLIPLALEVSGMYGGKLAHDIHGRWLITIDDPAGNWRLQGQWQVDSGEPLSLIAKAAK